MLELTIKGDTKEIAELVKQFSGLILTSAERQEIAKKHFENGFLYALKTNYGKAQEKPKEDA